MPKKEKNPMVRNALFGVAAIAAILLLILIFKVQIPGLSMLETSCSGNLIWFKYSLSDEASRLSTIIPDCKTNPNGGWVGNIQGSVTSMNGTVTNLGGFSATSASTQKISCGGQPTTTGKSFFGNYIPNDGLGNYKVLITGTYYLASESYATAHAFQWTDNANAYCVLPSSTCPDGSALRACSQVTQGKWCGSDAVLYDKAGTCGCPSGYQATGNYCTPIPAPSTPPEQTVITYPTTETPSDNVSTTTTPPVGDIPSNPSSNEISYFGMPSSTWILILAAIIMVIAILFLFKVV